MITDVLKKLKKRITLFKTAQKYILTPDSDRSREERSKNVYFWIVCASTGKVMAFRKIITIW